MSNLGLWGKNPCFITFVLFCFATFVVCHLSCLTQPLQPLQPLQCLDFVSWGQLLHEETWAWKNVGFGRLLSVWMVRMPRGDPSFFSRWSSFSPCLVALTSGLFLLTQSCGLFFLTQRSVCPPYGLLIHAQRERLFSPHAQAGILMQKIGYVFPVYFSVGCKLFLTHRPLRSIFP